MLDGAIEPKAIAKRAQELGFPAAALTDRNGLYAAMAFSDAARRRACSRSSARCWASRGPTCPRASRRRSTGWRSMRRTRPAIDNLCALVVDGASRPADRAGAACRFRRAGGAHRRADRADRGRRGRAGAAVRRGSARARARPMPTGLQALFRERLYIELARRRDAIEGRAEDASDRPRLCARSAAGRDQPVLLRRGRFPRRARRDAVHRRFDLCRERGPAAQLARCVDEARQGDAARCSPICPRRSPTRWSSRSAAPSRRPSRKPILPSLAGDPAARGDAAAPRCARPGWRRGSTGSRSWRQAGRGRLARRPIATGSSSSSTSSSRWAFRAIS